MHNTRCVRSSFTTPDICGTHFIYNTCCMRNVSCVNHSFKAFDTFCAKSSFITFAACWSLVCIHCLQVLLYARYSCEIIIYNSRCMLKIICAKPSSTGGTHEWIIRLPRYLQVLHTLCEFIVYNFYFMRKTCFVKWSFRILHQWVIPVLLSHNLKLLLHAKNLWCEVLIFKIASKVETPFLLLQMYVYNDK